MLTKYGESPQIINAALCGHENVEPETIEAVLTEAADGISAARPGARRDVLESYIKRLAKLEEIAMSYKGVEMCYAIQAGRELRIMTKSEQISDLDAPPARQGHLQAHRGRDAVPRPHQGHRDPRDARGGSGQVTWRSRSPSSASATSSASPGRKAVHALLPRLRKQYEADLAVVNVENAAAGFGVTPLIARTFLEHGVDVMTSGNHIWDKKEIIEYIVKENLLLRPANFPAGTPGVGHVIVKARPAQGRAC